MKGYLYVTDWSVWQSYRSDRGTPPWVKIHRRVMTSAKWAALSDSEKGQLVSIWIAAADRNGFVPSDANVLRKICGLDSKPNLNKFIDLEYLTPDGCHDDVKVTSERRQGDAPETETETETETEKKRDMCVFPGGNSPFEHFWQAWPIGYKASKKRCQEIWKRKQLDPEAETLVADVKHRHANCAKWINGYIPNPSTYLNQEKWHDDIQPQRKPARRETLIESDLRKRKDAIAKIARTKPH